MLTICPLQPWILSRRSRYDVQGIFQQILDSCKLELHDPTHVVGNPSGAHDIFCDAPITRIPVGDQIGRPSWIDHGVSDGTVTGAWILWEDMPSDHASIVARCKCVGRPVAKFKRHLGVRRRG